MLGGVPPTNRVLDRIYESQALPVFRSAVNGGLDTRQVYIPRIEIHKRPHLWLTKNSKFSNFFLDSPLRLVVSKPPLSLLLGEGKGEGSVVAEALFVRTCRKGNMRPLRFSAPERAFLFQRLTLTVASLLYILS